LKGDKVGKETPFSFVERYRIIVVKFEGKWMKIYSGSMAFAGKPCLKNQFAKLPALSLR
jgi:hypothetical protein